MSDEVGSGLESGGVDRGAGVFSGSVRFIAAGVAGVLAVAALPPFSALPALGAFAVLYALCLRRAPLSAFLCGYAFGLGFFALGLSWIAESFYVEAERFGWMAVPAVAALAAFLSLFPAAAAATFAVSRQQGGAGAVAFAACWTGFEWLRGHVLTGFPWNLAGYSFADYTVPRQAAAFVGAYGLSFLAVLIAALAAAVFTARSGRDRMAAAVCFGLIVAVAVAVGQGRLLSGASDGPVQGESSRPVVRVVQGNVPQERKWDPDYRDEIIGRYLELSARPGGFDVLLWPETAFPGYLDEDLPARDAIASILPKGTFLLAGTPDRQIREGTSLFRNAVVAIDDGGAVHARYYKHHLVPFGEYVPLGQWLPIERLTAGAGAFTAGSGPKTLRAGSLPAVGVSICYEAVFPGHVVDTGDRPAWMLNATNDAWFGTSIGPWQHLASARIRTVEEGLPMVRAANTGISVVMDAYGRTVGQIAHEETGVLDVALPPPLAATPYSRFGDWLLLPLILGAWIAARLADAAAKRRFSLRHIRNWRTIR